jgi:hypothetical protein
MPILIRGSIHTTKFANKGKLDNLNDFLIEYNRVTWLLNKSYGELYEKTMLRESLLRTQFTIISKWV